MCYLVRINTQQKSILENEVVKILRSMVFEGDKEAKRIPFFNSAIVDAFFGDNDDEYYLDTDFDNHFDFI